jgi:GNAT superfamily N-acetyltransferase
MESSDFFVYTGKPCAEHSLGAATVWNQAFGHRTEPFVESPINYLIVVYTVSDGLPVAAATLSEVYPHGCNVQAVGAYPSGKGYGSVLMNNIISFSRTLSTPPPALYLHMNRDKTLPHITAFYERFGFVVDATFMKYTNDDGVAMLRV